MYWKSDMQMTSQEHFLNELCDLQCTSRMNTIYYERRLAQIRRYPFWMDVVVALAASGSGLASIIVVGYPIGVTLLRFLAVAAAIVAVVRPIYRPEAKMESFLRQAEFYTSNFFDLKALSSQVKQSGKVRQSHRQTFAVLSERHKDASKRDERPSKRSLLHKAMEEVREEMPAGEFWWPDVSK